MHRGKKKAKDRSRTKTYSKGLTKEEISEDDDRRDRKVYKQTGFFFFCLSLSFASLSRLASRLLNSSGIFS
jgi:hypothetical protein